MSDSWTAPRQLKRSPRRKDSDEGSDEEEKGESRRVTRQRTDGGEQSVTDEDTSGKAYLHHPSKFQTPIQPTPPFLQHPQNRFIMPQRNPQIPQMPPHFFMPPPYVPPPPFNPYYDRQLHPPFPQDHPHFYGYPGLPPQPGSLFLRHPPADAASRASKDSQTNYNVPHVAKGPVKQSDKDPVMSTTQALISRSREVLDRITHIESEPDLREQKEKRAIKLPAKSSEEQAILNRRERKNAQSRARAAKLREKIKEVKIKPDEAKSEEEKKILNIFEERRRKKNERSRERAIEKKNEIERILSKPEKDRTEKDVEVLTIAMKAKEKKNRGDRLRREKIKMMGLSSGKESTRGRPRKKPPSSEEGKSDEALQPTSTHAEPRSPILSSLTSHAQPDLTSPGGFSSQLLGFPSPPGRGGFQGTNIPRQALSLVPPESQVRRQLTERPQERQESTLNIGLFESGGNEAQSRLPMPVEHPLPDFILYGTNVNAPDDAKDEEEDSVVKTREEV